MVGEVFPILSGILTSGVVPVGIFSLGVRKSNFEVQMKCSDFFYVGFLVKKNAISKESPLKIQL